MNELTVVLQINFNFMTLKELQALAHLLENFGGENYLEAIWEIDRRIDEWKWQGKEGKLTPAERLTLAREVADFFFEENSYEDDGWYDE